MNTDPHSPDTNAQSEQMQDAANANAPLTQDQLMQAATARIAELETELAEMKDRWMRAEAETSNVRARGRREADDARQYAVQKFATDIVEAAENLKRGIDALPPATPGEPDILVKVREGLAGIERSFTGVLERNGIRKDDPVGQPFDPNLHQAMAEQDSEVHPPGTVMQAWTACWTLNGRLLKPAMVVVAKAPTPELPSSGYKINTTA
jgi:molecular chaperone GrpE